MSRFDFGIIIKAFWLLLKQREKKTILVNLITRLKYLMTELISNEMTKKNSMDDIKQSKF